MPLKRTFVEKGIQLMQINEYLSKVLDNSGFAGCELQKTALGLRIKIKTARPGLVIGKKGMRIRELGEELYNKFKIENPQIDVEPIETPELNAQIMAEAIAFGIKKGQNSRRTAYSIMRRIIRAGARGVEVKISGKSTSQRARTQIFRAGVISKCGVPAIEGVDSGISEAVMKSGTIGIQVKIMPLSYKLPDEIFVKDPELKAKLEKKKEKQKIREEELEESEVIIDKTKKVILEDEEEEEEESIFDETDEEIEEIESDEIEEEEIEIEEEVETEEKPVKKEKEKSTKKSTKKDDDKKSTKKDDDKKSTKKDDDKKSTKKDDDKKSTKKDDDKKSNKKDDDIKPEITEEEEKKEETEKKTKKSKKSSKKKSKKEEDKSDSKKSEKKKKSKSKKSKKDSDEDEKSSEKDSESE